MEVPFEVANSEDQHKPWMILVNGLFASRHSWSEVKAHLTKHFRVLTYDGRGQGEGPRPIGPYRFDEAVTDLKELLDSAGIFSAHFLGISQGGRIALKFAELFPGRVLGTIACDTYSEITPLLGLKINSWLMAHRIGGALHRFDTAAPWIWGESLLTERPELYEFYRTRSNVENPRVVERLIESSLDGHINLEKIVTPVLYAVGEEDVLTPISLHQKMKARTRGSDLVVIRGGHASILEYPASISEIILHRYFAMLDSRKLASSEKSVSSKTFVTLEPLL